MREQIIARFVNYRSLSEKYKLILAFLTCYKELRVTVLIEGESHLRNTIPLKAEPAYLAPKSPENQTSKEVVRRARKTQLNHATPRPVCDPRQHLPEAPETQATTVWVHTASFLYSDPSQGQGARHHRPPLPLTGPRCLGLSTQEGP